MSFLINAIVLLILIVLIVPLGIYISKTMEGEHVFLSRCLAPLERSMCKILKIKDENKEMSWKEYLLAVILFSVFSFLAVFLLCLMQGILPLNPQKIDGNTIALAFNTAVSFMTNTNWQAYSGESSLSYLTQMLGLTAQNFVSAGVGGAVLFALIRGIKRHNSDKIGNFYIDLYRFVMYVLLPLSVIECIFLMSQGVPQTFSSYKIVNLVEPFIDADGVMITHQIVPLGPAASQIAIKQLGTNGGGFFGVNSAFPLENPTLFSNMIQLISILLIPGALCISFGRSLNNKKAGILLLVTMFVFLVAALIVVNVNEATYSLNNNLIESLKGNLEGKETRFGTSYSSIWAVFTTAASNGSVNSMHDSFTPIGGMVLLFLMELGEVIFGGVGCGLYGMIGFVLITVFICGLMVGRIPEYLGKKVEPFEMKMAMLTVLATPLAVLLFSSIASLVPSTIDSLNNVGPHGFSELLYAFSSGGGNNGSAFAGFNANTPLINTLMGLTMLLARFLPIVAILALSGSLAKKKIVATNEGSLKTESVVFGLMVGVIIIIVGALSFLPALCLGPLEEFIN